MRIIKDAAIRKDEILDASEALFNSKGFDGTTISEIVEKVGLARGTIYYHFKSKEEILDALIQRREAEFLKAGKQVACDKSIPVMERLIRTLFAMNGEQEGSTELTRQMHKPQNALMHQKTHQTMLESIPPILMIVIEDGIAEGLFDTPYPYESLEMVVAHVNTVFDDYAESLEPEALQRRIKAFIFNLERLFGAKYGSFDRVLELFQEAGDDKNE